MKDIVIYTNNGLCVSEKYNPNETIIEFKKRLKNKLSIPTYFQKIFLGDGKTELLDRITFSNYIDIESGLCLINLNELNVVIHLKTMQSWGYIWIFQKNK